VGKKKTSAPPGRGTLGKIAESEEKKRAYLLFRSIGAGIITFGKAAMWNPFIYQTKREELGLPRGAKTTVKICYGGIQCGV